MGITSRTWCEPLRFLTRTFSHQELKRRLILGGVSKIFQVWSIVKLGLETPTL